MKRYDTDEQMRTALDVFLYDTLTDPDMQYVDNLLHERSFAEAQAQAPLEVTLETPQGEIVVNADMIGATNSNTQLRGVIFALLASKSGLTADQRQARVRLAQVALTRLEQIG